jgi:hypothetical protein
MPCPRTQTRVRMLGGQQFGGINRQRLAGSNSLTRVASWADNSRLKRCMSLCLCLSVCVSLSAASFCLPSRRAGQAFMGGLGGMAHNTLAHRYGIWTCVRGWDAREQRRCGEALLA